MSTTVSRGIDRRALWPPPVRMSRMESERLGPLVLAPGSLVPLERWSEPRNRTGGGGNGGGPVAASAAVAGQRLLGGVVDARLLDLGRDEEEDQRQRQPDDDGDRQPLQDPPGGDR